jgi:hypothetical protein
LLPTILAILFMLFGILAPNDFRIIWISSHLTVSLHDSDHSRNR